MKQKFQQAHFALGKSLRSFSHNSRRVFEFARIKQTVGLLVASAVFSLAIVPNSISAVQTQIDRQQAQIELKTEAINTPKTLRLPVDNFALTQGFHFLHPALDFAAVKGSPVYPIMGGVIEEAKYGRFGYGNMISVDHGNGLRSLYAHLSKIEVKEGESVTQESIIGLIGSTGWSTGPHLHFQLWQEGKTLNPRAFFESYLGEKLASTR